MCISCKICKLHCISDFRSGTSWCIWSVFMTLNLALKSSTCITFNLCPMGVIFHVFHDCIVFLNFVYQAAFCKFWLWSMVCHFHIASGGSLWPFYFWNRVTIILELSQEECNGETFNDMEAINPQHIAWSLTLIAPTVWYWHLCVHQLIACILFSPFLRWIAFSVISMCSHILMPQSRAFNTWQGKELRRRRDQYCQ